MKVTRNIAFQDHKYVISVNDISLISTDGNFDHKVTFEMT